MNGITTKTENILWALVGVAWIGNAMYAAGQSNALLQSVASFVVASAMIGFILLHARHRFTPRLLLTFVAVIAAIAWLVESVGVVTGLPFGRYQYTQVMAPFLGQVPVFVLIAYAVMGYLAYMLALVFVHILAPGRIWAIRIALPILAAGLMVIWDLSMDPLRATHEGRWLWLDGGAHLGVPWSNFVGWFGVTWAFFQVFTLLAGNNLPAIDPLRDRALPLMYAAFAGEYLINPLVAAQAEASIIVNGQEMALGGFYTAVASVCLTSMIPVALAGMALLWIHENRAYLRGIAPNPVRRE